MLRTLFADERVVPVVGVVRVTKSSVRIFEFEKLVAVLARVTRAVCDGGRGERGATRTRDAKGQSVKNWQRICVLVSV
jgi:hypothetical protein